VDAVPRVAESRGLPMSQVALAWLLTKPVVSAPIVAATKPHYLSAAAAAVEVTLTEDETGSSRSRPASGWRAELIR
jgi:aryl-alcohol dehydrogenase-like predicted oxidoreductase